MRDAFPMHKEMSRGREFSKEETRLRIVHKTQFIFLPKLSRNAYTFSEIYISFTNNYQINAPARDAILIPCGLKVNINIEVGRIVKYFVLSDLFLLAGWGFVDPVFSVFIVERIAGGTLITVGIAAALYWILKSILQVPIAKYLDRTPGEKDDFKALIFGLFLAGFSAIAFTWVHAAWELYVVQSVHALAFAFYGASWPTIFSRHLDKNRISFDWTLDSTTAGIAAGVTGLFGGIVAEIWGFTAVFIACGILSFIAAFVLLSVPDLILPKPIRVETKLMEHTPGNLGV